MQQARAFFLLFEEVKAVCYKETSSTEPWPARNLFSASAIDTVVIEYKELPAALRQVS